MFEITLCDIKDGWRTEGAGRSECAGRPVTDVDILIDDGQSMALPPERIVLGEPWIAWIPFDAIRKNGPYGSEAVVIEKRRLSGANRFRASTIRTLKLIREASAGGQSRIEAASILAGLVAARNLRSALRPRVHEIEIQLAQVLGYRSADQIWSRQNAAPLPRKPPETLTEIACECSGRVLGGMLRQWHDMVFDRYVAVRATPVRGGTGTLTLRDFGMVAGRPVSTTGEWQGVRDWSSIDAEELEVLVWTHPRMELATLFGVTDVAINRRCQKFGIPVPPRGYWQKLGAGEDPRDLFGDPDNPSIVPPRFVTTDLDRRFRKMAA